MIPALQLHVALPSTGWRDITEMWSTIRQGQVLLLREGPWVRCQWVSTVYGETGVDSSTPLTGFEPIHTGDLGDISSLKDSPEARRVTWIRGGLAVVRPVVDDIYRGGLWWYTSAPWPTILPGEPVM